MFAGQCRERRLSTKTVDTRTTLATETGGQRYKTFFSLQNNLRGFGQGSLTEGERSVQLTSSYHQVEISSFLNWKYYFSFLQEQATLMRRSTVLSLPNRLVFPANPNKGSSTLAKFIGKNEGDIALLYPPPHLFLPNWTKQHKYSLCVALPKVTKEEA